MCYSDTSCNGVSLAAYFPEISTSRERISILLADIQREVTGRGEFLLIVYSFPRFLYEIIIIPLLKCLLFIESSLIENFIL